MPPLEAVATGIHQVTIEVAAEAAVNMVRAKPDIPPPHRPHHILLIEVNGDKTNIKGASKDYNKIYYISTSTLDLLQGDQLSSRLVA